MILRRVTEHVKAQNWFAVGLDFVIVVTGVFIGIQVSNWNATRADDARARGYLERIRADLDADVAGYRSGIDFWNSVAAYGATGLAYAEGDMAGEANPWEILLAYFQASQLSGFWTTQATYEEMRSVGDLGLIADPEFRNRLAQYYTTAGNGALGERPGYREHVRGAIPLDIQLYIWEHCYSTDVSGSQELHDCVSPIGGARAAAIVDKLSSDEALMAKLRSWMSTMHVASTIGRDRIASAEQLRALVDAELGDDATSERYRDCEVRGCKSSSRLN